MVVPRMKFLIPLLAALFLLIACSTPTASLDDIATPRPTAEMARVSNLPLDKLVRGYDIYQRQCSECHEERLPSTANFADFQKEVHSMAKLAKLTVAEEDDLQTYLDQFDDR